MSSAKAMGRPLLWTELVLLLSLGGLAISPAISYEDAGWYKYSTVVIGLGGAVYVALQLYLLDRDS